MAEKKPYNNYLRYSNMAFQLLAAICLGTWIGKMLDGYFSNSTPYCAGFGALIGVCLGLYVAIKDVIFPNKNEKK